MWRQLYTRAFRRHLSVQAVYCNGRVNWLACRLTERRTHAVNGNRTAAPERWTLVAG